jgi:hypothetical protein
MAQPQASMEPLAEAVSNVVEGVVEAKLQRELTPAEEGLLMKILSRLFACFSSCKRKTE